MSLPLRILRSSAVKGRFFLSAARPMARTNLAAARAFSSNITYSGGQATEGQGGFYGSGGVRSIPESGSTPEDERQKMVALSADVQTVSKTMEELDRLEALLDREETEKSGQVSGRTIEIKNSIKKLMTSSEFLDVLNRLEVNGEPAWGLSTSERELVTSARQKVNEC